MSERQAAALRGTAHEYAQLALVAVVALVAALTASVGTTCVGLDGGGVDGVGLDGVSESQRQSAPQPQPIRCSPSVATSPVDPERPST